jgi:hypothetical protein
MVRCQLAADDAHICTQALSLQSQGGLSSLMSSTRSSFGHGSVMRATRRMTHPAAVATTSSPSGPPRSSSSRGHPRSGLEHSRPGTVRPSGILKWPKNPEPAADSRASAAAGDAVMVQTGARHNRTAPQPADPSNNSDSGPDLEHVQGSRACTDASEMSECVQGAPSDCGAESVSTI